MKPGTGPPFAFAAFAVDLTRNVRAMRCIKMCHHWAAQLLSDIASRVSRAGRLGGRGQVECNVYDEVFLAADQTASADFQEDGPDVDSVSLGCCFGVAEE